MRLIDVHGTSRYSMIVSTANSSAMELALIVRASPMVTAQSAMMVSTRNRAVGLVSKSELSPVTTVSIPLYELSPVAAMSAATDASDNSAPNPANMALP